MDDEHTIQRNTEQLSKDSGKKHGSGKVVRIMTVIIVITVISAAMVILFRNATVKKAKMTGEEYMNLLRDNMVEIEPYESKKKRDDVDYGKLEKVTYYSETCKRERNVNVLLPDGYNPFVRYPVMYCLHGYWGNEDSLLDQGDASLKITQIVGNAIADGKAEKMILVFPYIYASAERDVLSGMNDESNRAYDNFINDLVNDLMPFIESKYSIATGKDNTAITGFSMGGRESLYIGFSRPDLFGYIGAVCPAPGVTELIQPDNLKFGEEKPYLLMISAGSNDQVVWSVPQGYYDTLTRNNVDFIWNYVHDGDHGGFTIRPHMYNFICSVFKA